jgi:septal ring factor EnvC (AmiA/AmiB activator)
MSGYLTWMKSLSDSRTHASSDTNRDFWANRAQFLAMQRSQEDMKRLHKEAKNKKTKEDLKRLETAKKLRELDEDAVALVSNKFDRVIKHKVAELKLPPIATAMAKDADTKDAKTDAKASALTDRDSAREIALLRRKLQNQRKTRMRLYTYYCNHNSGERACTQCRRRNFGLVPKPPVTSRTDDL